MYVSQTSPASSTVGQKIPSEIRLSPRQQMTMDQAALVKPNAYAPEVEERLTTVAASLQQIVTDPVIIAGVQAANEKDKLLSTADITLQDEQWIASKELTPFISAFMTNATAQQLTAYQRDNPGFKELFIADAYGLNVGQTDKTSDFYQADESWWVNAMKGGQGKVFHGKIEFDQSSQTEAISIYVPVIDPSTRIAIGVLKAVLDVSSIGHSL